MAEEPPETPEAAEAPESADADGETPGASVVRELEAVVGCRVIVYHSATTYMEKWDLRPLYNLLEAMGPQPRAALVIQSPGGSADAAHGLSSLLHDYIKDLHIYVVRYAASAATILALAADTLWMGPGAELSPVDPQVPIDPRMLIPTAGADADDLPPSGEPAYVPAHVIRDFLELTGVMEAPDAGYPRQKIQLERLEGLFRPLNPWILGWYERADKISRLYAKDALVHHLLKANGAQDDAEDPERRAAQIVHTLLDGYASHETGIQREEARRIGIPVMDCPTDVWDQLQLMQDWYDEALHSQNVGRILETTDGVHVVPARPERQCGNCEEIHEVGPDFNYCPSCGHALNLRCPQCERSLRGGWLYCPKCAHPVPSGPAKTGQAETS